jgi:transcriptional regulator with XRE-family HTH domain
MRRAAGLTQQQLATALGLTSTRAVKAWERGDYAPSLSAARPLARALGISLEELVEAVVGPELAPTGEAALGKAQWTPISIGVTGT